jgi:hypothetical protein
MVRGTLERVLGANRLDAWFARTAQKQYTRTLLFSTVYDILCQVVFRIKPSVRAAYQDHAETAGASLISVYNKLNCVEPSTSAALVRYSVTALGDHPMGTDCIAISTARETGSRRALLGTPRATAWPHCCCRHHLMRADTVWTSRVRRATAVSWTMRAHA